MVSFFFHLVGITWDDAPTEQHAVIKTDYKIRCVVLASPPATIDWLKESLIVSTGRSFWHFVFLPFRENGASFHSKFKATIFCREKKSKRPKGPLSIWFPQSETHFLTLVFLLPLYYYYLLLSFLPFCLPLFSLYSFPLFFLKKRRTAIHHANSRRR